MVRRMRQATHDISYHYQAKNRETRMHDCFWCPNNVYPGPPWIGGGIAK
jgi:hypothetical protein